MSRFNLIHRLNQGLIRRAVLMTAIVALLVPIIWLEHRILIHTHGTIAYPLDDAFFNLTLAKNLAFEHVWGITKYSFTSVSTSLLYPFVLAVLFLITGASLVVPLLLNLAAAIWLLIAMQRWLIRRSVRPVSQLFILLAVIFLTPLPPLVVSGMEYPLELLFTFLFVSSLTETPGPTLSRRTYVYAIFMLTSSYQTLPVLILACVLLVTRRGWWEAVRLLFIAVLPLYLFGLLSILKHSYFVPNPLVLTPGFTPLSANPYYLGFLVGCAVAFAGAWLAKNGTRVAKGSARIAITRTQLFLPVLLAVPLLIYSVTTFRQTPAACIDVYTEQYQTAKFVYDFYYHEPVASNDLGAISFCAEDERIIDLAGLANLEVLRRQRIHNWTPEAADSLSERMNANVAILHHSWTDAEVEPYWYRIATWQLRGDTVSFYSIDKRYIEKLQTRLHAFQPKLPPDVTVRYYTPIDLPTP